MTRTTTLWLALVTLTIAPAASATGYLVNWNGSGFGANVFGGQGDTLDVGLFNYQCTDEDDVVDVGVANREGDASCGYYDPYSGKYVGCEPDEGRDPIQGVSSNGLLGDPATHPHDPHCSDDGDTVDVGLLNREGGYQFGGHQGEQCYPQQRYEWDPSDPWNEPTVTYAGDVEDAVDVGVLNVECGDDDDANDVGVLNCEWLDRDDGNDLGLLNWEFWDDSSDTFDLSLINSETIDGPDRNGLNLLPGGLGLFLCGLVILDTVGPVVDLPILP